MHDASSSFAACGLSAFLGGRPRGMLADGASAQIDVEIVHVAVDVLVVAEGRHDVFLAAADVLAPFGDDREEGGVVHVLQRVGQGRRIARADAVGPVADVAVGMVAAIAAECVPVDGAVVLDFEGRVSVRVEILAVLVGDRGSLLLGVLSQGGTEGDAGANKKNHDENLDCFANGHSNLFLISPRTQLCCRDAALTGAL